MAYKTKYKISKNTSEIPAISFVDPCGKEEYANI